MAPPAYTWVRLSPEYARGAQGECRGMGKPLPMVIPTRRHTLPAGRVGVAGEFCRVETEGKGIPLMTISTPPGEKKGRFHPQNLSHRLRQALLYRAPGAGRQHIYMIPPRGGGRENHGG